MNDPWFEKRVRDGLNDRLQHGLYREERSFRQIGPARLEVDGRELINFGSNDYLGLAWNPQLHQAALAEPSRGSSWGAGASPLVTGRTIDHATLERDLARWKGFEASLTFSSGYSTNISTIEAIARSGDHIFSDELNHASLIDGCRLSRADVTVYPHLDFDFLVDALSKASKKRNQGQGLWIVTDTVFSMEGDFVDMGTLLDIATRFDAGLILDEAHAVGIYGQRGQGLFDQVDRDFRPIFCVGTCSKALGSIGGYLCGSRAAIDYVRQFARGYIYSTAMPAAAARATSKAVELCAQMESERLLLRQTSLNFREKLRSLGFATSSMDSPICPVILGDATKVSKMSLQLAERGFLVPAIRPPTVPPGRSLLRVSLSVSHTPAQIESLLSAISELISCEG